MVFATDYSMGYGGGGDPNIPQLFVITAFVAIALYNFIELNIIMYSTFKRRNTLYFWSFFFATWGVAFHTLGFILQIFDIAKNGYVYITIATIGWIPMVTGQSLLLYSRLHLILHKKKVLRMVLGMIITNIFVTHLPTSVLTYGSVASPHSELFIPVYVVYEKIEVTLFFIQEVIISAIYIWCCQKHFRILRGPQSRQMIKHLCIINIIIIILDITILALECSGLHDLQIAYKSMVYSIKLKLEFATLNSLVKIATAKPETGNDPRSVGGQNTQLDDKGGTASIHYKEEIEMRATSRGKAFREGEAANSRNDRPSGGYDAFIEAGDPFDKPGDGILVVTSIEVAQNQLLERDLGDNLETQWPITQQEDLTVAQKVKSSSSSQEHLAGS